MSGREMRERFLNHIGTVRQILANILTEFVLGLSFPRALEMSTSYNKLEILAPSIPSNVSAQFN